MKKLIIPLLVVLNVVAFGQIQVVKTDGGSVVTKLGINFSLNTGSSLKRSWIILNDTNSPLQLDQVGINSAHSDSEYRFRAKGNLVAREPITGYKIHHVLYDIFGDHIKTLNDTEVSDFAGTKELNKYASWYASENQVSEYLVCVSFVTTVRTLKGVIWHCDFKAIKEQLNEIEVKYEEEAYAPPTNKEK